jgi:hypothetical protein
VGGLSRQPSVTGGTAAEARSAPPAPSSAARP